VAVLAMLFVGIFSAVITGMLDDLRISELPPLPADWSRVPEFETDQAVCSVQYETFSILDLIGLAFGPYDLNNTAVFETQLDYIFGPGAHEFITYTAHEAVANVPFIHYKIGGVSVFGLRGFTTSQEFALQVEIIARHYVLPLLLELTPLYDWIKDQWLARYTEFAYFFGLHWFSPMSQFDGVIQGIKKVYDDAGLTETDRVVFVGANIGGVLAKVLGMITHHRGIGFVSLPSVDEEFSYRYQYDDLSMRWGTNVFTNGGIFGVEDPDIAENYQLPGEGDITSADGIYQTFCVLSEVCGHGPQFRAYCEKVVGEEKLKEIRDFLKLDASSQ
jgi:hypothetical protein